MAAQNPPAHWEGTSTMRAELIGHFEPCMTEIYLHIDARMADYMATHRMTHRCIFGLTDRIDRLSFARGDTELQQQQPAAVTIRVE